MAGFNPSGLSGGGVISGNLILTGNLTVQGIVDITLNQTLQGQLIVDVDNTQAFLVRKDGDLGDVLAINTVTPAVIVNGDVLIGNNNGLVIGHTTQITGNQLVEVQVLGTGSVDSAILLGRWDNSAGSPQMEFVKSRSATIGSHAIVFDNDKIMRWRFLPDDGVDFATVAAEFQVEVDDASPEAGFVGTAFVWRQMPGGNGNGIAETMRISAAGDLTLKNDLAVTEGGSGAGTFTDGGILLGSGTGAFTALGVATNGQIPIGDGATDPVLATITGTANEVSVANGAGSITLGLPANVILTGDTIQADGTGLIIGHTSQITAVSALEFQVLGTGFEDSAALFARWGNNSVGPSAVFLKSRNTTIGSNTIVQDNDQLGIMAWLADDGVDFNTVAAEFRVEVDDATPEAGFIGAAFVWRQMSGGNGNSITETMRLSAAGVLEVVGDVKVNNANFALEGYAAGRNVIRTILLRVQPGATPGTNINASDLGSLRDFNPPTITDGTNIAKSGSSGSFALSADGTTITLDITEDVVGIIGTSIRLHDINSSSTTEMYFSDAFITGTTNMGVSLIKRTSGGASDWTTIMDAGDVVDIYVSFITSS